MKNFENEPANDPFREELLRVQLEIQEHGLEMIRKEIYENVGQVLSLVKLHLSDASPAKDQQLNKTIAFSKKLVGKAIKDLRNVAKPVTMLEIEENGIIDAIQHELDTLARINNRKTNFTVNEKIFRFDIAKEVIVFRIMQELISVFVDVAVSKPISIQADYQRKEVSFVISNGRQSQQEGPPIHPDTWFANSNKMQIRADMINADLAFYGNPDGDLTILLKLPLTK